MAVDKLKEQKKVKLLKKKLYKASPWPVYSTQTLGNSLVQAQLPNIFNIIKWHKS